MKSYRFEIKHHRDTSWSLKISDIELDDDDTYRCRAGDNTFAEAKLTVEGLQTDILLFGLHRDKPVFGVYDKASFKPVSSAT